ncbi:cAMP-binding domain of CRP or a regulatory subunit of cAMP-dependent protein kinases [Zunongwangia mangrovi]|uniref:cAMP-binding domain of CRP or a regulatory subunit of cAMP-dependent protein kinases n=1 Tax=Zunongwangia mangrovi TaxID=1334022 RepID=A0A1I1MFB6_9FLAO|nr:response regulator [Zunongwangia mangrovi]SFC84069.1 cAMP-binding domain of CRP or a regulatory subunit of cAMP-dependent protein kinases [Zunongwangia mangrovi]
MILLIEDDTVLRENTAEILELQDYEVITAPNGKIGIEKAIKHVPDIIICDIMMPEVDGYGVLQALSSNTETHHIPFIFLSAKTEHKEIRRGMNMGADDYLTKPFDEEELVEVIETRLKKANLVSQVFVAQAPDDSNPEEDIRNLNELKNFFDDEGEDQEFKKKDSIYEAGDHSNYVYLILEGTIKTFQRDEEGKELVTGLYKPDDFLGFTSLAENYPHQESAVAVENTKLVRILKYKLKEVLEQNKNVSLELINMLSDNLSLIKQQLLIMAYSTVRKKTAQTILQFVDILGKKPNEDIRITRSDLASVAGIAIETLIRTLSAFKKEGLIEIEGRVIRVLDLHKLEMVD